MIQIRTRPTLDVFCSSALVLQSGGPVTHTAGTGSRCTVNFTHHPLNGSFTYTGLWMVAASHLGDRQHDQRFGRHQPSLALEPTKS